MNENNLNQGNEPKKSNALLIVLIIIIVLLISVIAIVLVTKDNNNTSSNQTMNNMQNNSNISENQTVIDNTQIEKTLDINSDLVKNLAKPFVNNKGLFTGNTANYGEKIFTDDKYKIYLAMESLAPFTCSDSKYKQGEGCESAEKWIKVDGVEYNIYVEADKVEKEYKKIFGENSLYENKNLASKIEYCGMPYHYDSKTNRYLGIDACGGGELYSYFELYKAEQNNNDIVLYFYSYELDGNESSDLILIKSNNTVLKEVQRDEINTKIESNKLKNDGKISTYKITFTKQSDGNYYVSKGEWQ